MSNAFTIQGVPQLQQNLASFIAGVQLKTQSRAELFAASTENLAKSTRPWTDRTGNARRSITGSSSTALNIITVALAIGVDYGKWLELKNGGRYAVVWPTINVQRARFLPEMTRGVWSK